MVRVIPTTIRAESLERFKKLYNQKYDFKLTDKQAQEQGLKLLRLFITLLEQTELALDKQDTSVID